MRLKLTPAFVQKPPEAIIAIHLEMVRAEEPDRAVNEKPDRVVVWDTQDRGFGLMVTAGGHKSYVVQYRHGRHSRRMHLKSGVSLRDARKEARGFSAPSPRAATRSPSVARPRLGVPTPCGRSSRNTSGSNSA